MPKRKVRITVQIDGEACKGCSYCVLNCPKRLIRIGDEFNSQGFYPAVMGDQGKCTGCALCAVACPDIAITIYREDDEQG